MAKAKTGTLGEVEWSSENNRPDLYSLARANEVPGLHSRSTKPEIVAALVKASCKQARKKERARKPPPQPPKRQPPKLRLVDAAPSPESVNATPKAAPTKPKTSKRRKLSQAERFRRQVERARR